MTWVAPEIEREQPLDVGGERESLLSWLTFYRQSLLWKCSGLTVEQLRLRSCEPSTMSLLGLVRHMTDVERAWFRQRIAGGSAPFQYWTDGDDDGDFSQVDTADAKQDFNAFAVECEFSVQATHGRDLDEVIAYTSKLGVPYERDIRWILVHMVEEYARHLGHADLLRERIDGATGY